MSAAGHPPWTELQALKAREMSDELDDRGKRKYTVAQISETFGVSRKTIYRHLERDHHPHRVPALVD